MSGGSQGPGRRLYRDREAGIFLGVCAGIADYFGFDLGVTRILTALALIFFMPMTLVLYFALALLLPKKPADVSPEADPELTRSMRAEPQDMLSKTRYRFRELELRLQRLEKYVTSSRYRLDREFESLKDS